MLKKMMITLSIAAATLIGGLSVAQAKGPGHYDDRGYVGKRGGVHKHVHHRPHALRPFEIRRSLRYRNYYKIRITDRFLPVYKAIACKRGKRFVLYMNRFGRIMDRERIGFCRHGWRGKAWKHLGPRGIHFRFNF